MECEQLADMVSTIGNKYKIAEINNCSVATVLNYCKRCNITKPKGFHKLPPDKRVVTRKNGWTEERRSYMRARFTGEHNPFHGKRHTATTRQKMSQNHADFNGDANPFGKSLHDETKRAEHKKRCKAIWETRGEVWRENFSEKLSRAMSSSERAKSTLNKRHKSGEFNDKKCGKAFFRSSWELELFTQLVNDENVIRFCSECLLVDYVDVNGSKRVSRLDVVVTLVGGYTVLIECKPQSLLLFNNNPEKIEAYKKAAVESGGSFILFSDDHVKNRNILKENLDDIIEAHERATV